MIYQKIFIGDTPYQIAVGGMGEYPEHRHVDFEFNYCINGSFDIVIDGVTRRVNEGCTAFVPPMCSHGVPQGNQCVAVTVVAGLSLLKSSFKNFFDFSMKPEVYDLNSDGLSAIKTLFCECAEAKSSGSIGSELVIVGNIYKIFACFLELISESDSALTDKKDISRIEDVEKAIEIIRFNYKEPLTVEQVAAFVGYSKSNFCKMFKKYVGQGFHQTLNNHRAKIAAALLEASNMSVAEIAAEVGFGDAKTFCRVFGSVYGVSPGKYRKSECLSVGKLF